MMFHLLRRVRATRRLAIRLWAAATVVAAAAPSFAGLTMSTSPDANTWVGTPVLQTMSDPTAATVEATLASNGAVSHSFNPATSFQLDTFTIRAAGAPTTGLLYLYPNPVGGGPADGFINNGFSVSLLNGGAGLPFTFNGTPSRTLLNFDLTGADQITLSAGTKYSIDLVGQSGGSMFWMRGAEVYGGGNIYVANPVGANPGERFNVAGGTRDGALALYAVPEPTSLVLFGLSLIGLAASRRRGC